MAAVTNELASRSDPTRKLVRIGIMPEVSYTGMKIRTYFGFLTSYLGQPEGVFSGIMSMNASTTWICPP
jgi:hypothetical protein